VRARSLLRDQVVQTALGALAIAWLTWPAQTIIPFETGVDPSWRAGLSMARQQSLDFGADIVFTYGPLGFLADPYLYFPRTAALAGLYVGLLQIAIAGSLIWAARATFGFLGAAAIAFAITKLAIVVVPTTLLIPPLVFLWCAYAVRRGSQRLFLILALAGAFLGALELLVRVTTGLVVLGLIGLTLVMERERRVRNLASFAAAAALSFLALWLATGQDLSAVPDFFLYSSELITGYVDAMPYEDPTLKWEYFAGAAVAGVVLFVGWRNTEGLSRSRRLKLLALGVALAYPTFKQQFVRHDPWHIGIWFFSAAVAIVALSWRRDTRAETALALVCALLPLGAGQLTLDEVNPIRSAERAVDQVRTMATSERLTRAGEARVALRELYDLDPAIVERVRGRTVHVYGYETGVAWAYPELSWAPLPVFQSYTAYTGRIDRLNARHLRENGPEFVLRGPDWPLNDRNHVLDAPATTLQLFCLYRPVATAGSWDLLARRPDRCGTPRKLGTVRTRLGEHFAVPQGSGRGLVVVDPRELPTTAWERLRTLLYRRTMLYAIVNGATTFRAVPGTAVGPIIARVPAGLDYPSQPLSLGATTLGFFEDPKGQGGPGPAMTVDVYEVPIT
jgi:hypothetical protein